jgi:hypothetical protein
VAEANPADYLERIWSIPAELDLKRELNKTQKKFFGGKLPRYSSEHEIKTAIGRHIEWFIFDNPLKRLGGRTPFEHFLHINQDKFGEEDREIYEGFNKNIFGIFEVKNIERGYGFTLRNLADDKEYEVREKRATYQLQDGQCIIGRIFPFRGYYTLSGGVRSWPREIAHNLSQGFVEIRERCRDATIDPLTIENIFNAVEYRGGR